MLCQSSLAPLPPLETAAIVVLERFITLRQGLRKPVDRLSKKPQCASSTHPRWDMNWCWPDRISLRLLALSNIYFKDVYDLVLNTQIENQNDPSLQYVPHVSPWAFCDWWRLQFVFSRRWRKRQHPNASSGSEVLGWVNLSCDWMNDNRWNILRFFEFLQNNNFIIPFLLCLWLDRSMNTNTRLEPYMTDVCKFWGLASALKSSNFRGFHIKMAFLG